MSTIDKATDYAQEAAEQLAGQSAQAAKALGEKGEQLRNAERKMVKEYGHYVTDHPLTALGIAMAAGFLLSRLVGDYR